MSSRRMQACVSAIIRALSWVRREFGVSLTVLLAGVILQESAALFPKTTERLYAQAAYPHLLAALSWFSRRFSFSVGEVLTAALLLAALVYVARSAILLYARPCERVRRAVIFLRSAVWTAAILLWVFLFVFGLNYQRPLLFELLGYEQRSASAPELELIGREVVGGTNESYAAAHEGERLVPGVEEIRALLNESYAEARALPVLPRGKYAAPKPLYTSAFMTRLGLSGIYCPFTGEPNYNADMPDFQLPFTIAHEMAHQRGVARESEANFVAYLVCVSSRDPFVRYSGYRNGLGVVYELYRLNPEKARELLRQLGPGYREDSRRAAAFWAKAGGVAGTLSQRVNDLYLRANRIKSGAADYSGSTALIIGYYLREMALEKEAAGS